MKPIGTLTYIYGLFKDNKCIYIGKSRTPYDRKGVHISNFDFDYCKIIDKFRDREIYWQQKYYYEGAKLLNKSNIRPLYEDWEIGDIVYFKNTYTN